MYTTSTQVRFGEFRQVFYSGKGGARARPLAPKAKPQWLSSCVFYAQEFAIRGENGAFGAICTQTHKSPVPELVLRWRPRRRSSGPRRPRCARMGRPVVTRQEVGGGRTWRYRRVFVKPRELQRSQR